MSKKKTSIEAFDKEGPQNLPEGYIWCPECQASFQDEVCPGCSPAPPGNPFTEGALHKPPLECCPACDVGPGGTTPIDENGRCIHCGRQLNIQEEAESTTLAQVAEQASTETTTITEILPVPLTDAEYKEFGILVSRANQEIAQAEDELKSVKSQYKSRIDSAEARRNEFAAIINAGHQQRQVECHLVKDFNETTVTLIRLDTGEIVRTRTMTTAERQMGLGFENPD